MQHNGERALHESINTTKSDATSEFGKMELGLSLKWCYLMYFLTITSKFIINYYLFILLWYSHWIVYVQQLISEYTQTG